MKKVLLLSVCATLFITSCGTYTGSGAYTGSMIGSVLGSAIGGISGGPRGSDIGTIVGMAGGAVIGGAIGAEADRARQRDFDEAVVRRGQEIGRDRSAAGCGSYPDGNSGKGSYGNGEDSGFDPNNGGDDRLDWGAPSPYAPAAASGIVMRNVRFIDDNNDGMLCSGEGGKITFEIMNYTSRPLYNVLPSVVETTGNRHVYVSPGICVEKIVPGRGVRYTAMVKCDNRVKNGEARFLLSVSHDGKQDNAVTQELNVRLLRD